MAELRFWLPEGTVLDGRYTVEATLGIGGYGITYRAHDNRLDRTVAVKEFFPAFMATRFTDRSLEVRPQGGSEASFSRGIDRFEAEAKTLAQLYHIHGIVKVSDFFEENRTAYLVMDYLDGKNLKQMTEGFGGHIPAEILIPVMSEIITALGKVHALGMIHRDISPDNIMMLQDGSVCLIDFGNARDTSDNRSLTLAMKEGFAPPEQHRGHGQGPYTDVYSLCATMYYCLTGKLPVQPMDRLLGIPFPKPSELGAVIDPVVEDVIMDGLELYVNKRIPSMEELASRLYSASAPKEESEYVTKPVTTPQNEDNGYVHTPTEKNRVQKTVPNSSGSEYYYGTIPLTRDVTDKNGTAPVQKIQHYSVTEETKIDSLDGLFNEGIFRIRKVCAGIFKKMKDHK